MHTGGHYGIQDDMGLKLVWFGARGTHYSVCYCRIIVFWGGGRQGVSRKNIFTSAILVDTIRRYR